MNIDPQHIDEIFLAALNKVSIDRHTAIDADATIDDLGLDSLGLTQIIVDLEERTGIEIPPEIIDRLAIETTAGKFFGILRHFFLSSAGK